jgi:hypothetical protein
MMQHELHSTIAQIFEKHKPNNYKIIRDPACEGKQQIHLFCSKGKSRGTLFCDVDLLILKSDKARIIVEIEESNIKPTQICGKYLTSALSNSYATMSQKEPIKLEKLLLFLQIVNAKNNQLKQQKKCKWKTWKKPLNK